MAVLVLGQQFDDGEITVQGDGLQVSDLVHVNLEVPVRTLCGSWVWNSDGMYKINIKTYDAFVMLRYFARARGMQQGSYT